MSGVSTNLSQILCKIDGYSTINFPNSKVFSNIVFSVGLNWLEI